MMKYWWKKMVCAGMIGGMLMLSNTAEAGLQNYIDFNCQHTNRIYFEVKDNSVDIQGTPVEYYAKKKKESVKYKCKICGKTYNLKLTAAGHVRGTHGKFVTSWYLQKVKE